MIWEDSGKHAVPTRWQVLHGSNPETSNASSLTVLADTGDYPVLDENYTVEYLEAGSKEKNS